jgi:hypothetical protein
MVQILSLSSDSGCCGVTLSQCHLLLEIEQRDSTSVTELARVMELDKSTLSRTIDGMVRAGLLNRELNQKSRRQQIISLMVEAVGAAEGIFEGGNYCLSLGGAGARTPSSIARPTRTSSRPTPRSSLQSDSWLRSCSTFPIRGADSFEPMACTPRAPAVHGCVSRTWFGSLPRGGSATIPGIPPSASVPPRSLQPSCQSRPSRAAPHGPGLSRRSMTRTRSVAFTVTAP